MRKLIPILLLASVAPAAIEVPADWLVLSPVDRRARRPFNPDAVYARYLIEPGKRTPKPGELVTGTRGERAWRWAKIDDKGRLGGRFAWAYTAVKSDRDQVAIATVRGGALLVVNGAPYVGDVYGYGHEGVPVRLAKGVNHVFVRGVRGSFQLAFREVDPGVHISTRGATLPDVVVGEALDAEGSVSVVNTADRMLHNVPALGVRRLAVRVRQPAPAEKGKRETELSPTQGVGATFSLDVREPAQARRVTFRSEIDGSVQYYGLKAPERADPSAGIVLTLHGAGVHARRQANCYATKPDLWIVAPTNRRPFGFDWQDWGRRDAYEVLADATKRTSASPTRVFLTGHSMGGHGSWHLGANDPDLWLAVAPCAGWESFDTYGSGGRTGTWDEIWRGADLSGATPLLISNLAQLPVFILHGEDDNTVPAAEARRMEEALKQAGGAPRMHLEPDKGHWYNGKASKGVDCVDWPGIFKLFGEQPLAPRDPDEIHFVSADPSVDSEHYWVTLLQPDVYGKLSRIEAKRADGRIVVKTDNVRRFRIRSDKPAVIEIDGQKLEAGKGMRFGRTVAGWRAADPAPHQKSPDRSGPFKRAFDRRFVLVYGADDPLGRRRALFDAQRWWYIANGDCTVVSDSQFRFGNYAGRNVILYGNADTNRAWKSVVPEECPVEVRKGAVRVGRQRFEGDDLSAFVVYPRRADNRALVGIVGFSGKRGARAGAAVSIFGSGVGIPDYVVFGVDVLKTGDEGVRAAGWFDQSWRLKP
ncbi:MAG: carboxylesterase family protein [Planctomycetota bacterium]|jgi:pimeloyl-ACP methyl ester carboxylesterase